MATRREHLRGGLADGMPVSAVNRRELARGARVEREHTSRPGVAREIAMDHLSEDPRYYEKLATMVERKNGSRRSRSFRRNGFSKQVDSPKTEAVIIAEAFEPEELTPGTIYVCQSGSEAWEFVRMGAAAGLLEVLGERDEADGTVVVTFRSSVGASSSRRNSGREGAITLGPEYFQAPLREYSEWPVKWWREVIQNSVDAGATEIRLGTIYHDDGSVTAFCEDNGGGMSESVLFEKFLVMGGTTKQGTDSNTVGGFGKAKELILLPWLSWRIVSGEFVVEAPTGGASYRVSSAPRFRGTRVEVRQPPGNHTNTSDLLEFLQRSAIPGVRFSITNNGVDVAFAGRRDMLFVDRQTPVRSFDNMDIYFIKSKTEKKSSHVYVRVNGLFMFLRYSAAVPGQLVVELKGSSLENLTSNRDGFSRFSIGNQLERYITEIAADTTSALKAKKGLVKKKYSQGWKFRAELPSPPELPWNGVQESEDRPGTRTMTPDGIREVLGQLQQRRRTESGGRAGGEGIQALEEISDREGILSVSSDLLQNLNLPSDRAFEEALKQLVWEPDFVLMNEVENLRIPSKYAPETMTTGVIRLAKMWAEICRWVLMQLGCGEPYAVGFLFDDDAQAAYQSENGENWILLNPLKLDREVSRALERISEGERIDVASLGMIRVTDRNDFRLLYALAVHECTHFANRVQYHDEAFASAVTYNFAKCADGMGQYRFLLNATANKRR